MLVDADGVFARTCSGALRPCGSSWVAEWCGKGLAACVLCELDVPPTAVLGFLADNVSATFGVDGGRGGAPTTPGLTRCVMSTQPFWKRELVKSSMCRHNTIPSAVILLQDGGKA